MEEILHQLICSLSHYLRGFIHPRWWFIAGFLTSMTSSWNSKIHHHPPRRPNVSGMDMAWIWHGYGRHNGLWKKSPPKSNSLIRNTEDLFKPCVVVVSLWTVSGKCFCNGGSAYPRKKQLLIIDYHLESWYEATNFALKFKPKPTADALTNQQLFHLNSLTMINNCWCLPITWIDIFVQTCEPEM